MKKFSRQLFLLLAILTLAASLRFWGITKADVITDEALIGFRSIGYLDFFVSPYQTTPYEWFLVVPAWAKLSFHDHPPLTFILQHLSFTVFGQNVFALRLPFVLAGIVSVYLLYLVSWQLFKRFDLALVGALLVAVSCCQVWISRIGLQESLVILFSLLSVWLFLRSLEDNRHWLWGLSLGLAALIKYTAFILLPVFFIYFLIYRRSVFRQSKFWLTLLLMLVIFSPVLIYNFKMFQERGHFDLQFSYLFNQPVEEWQFLPGKIQAGSLADRFGHLVPALFSNLMWPLFIVWAMSLIYFIIRARHNPNVIFLFLIIIFELLSFLIIGPSKRFVAVVVPYIIIFVAWFICQQPRLLKRSLLAILVSLELIFTINTLILPYPVGAENITYSNLKIESYQWGYKQLDDYLDSLLADKYPAVSFVPRYQFLEDIKNQAIELAENQGKESSQTLVIYDADMFDLATLWLFHRRMIYQGWPIITAQDYLSQSKEFWQEQGINDFYFFQLIDSQMLQQPEIDRTSYSQELVGQIRDYLTRKIKRPDGREVVAVYHWQ
ncbi:MAG: glycosyltransferase family 39 protein [Patescibacteria group bacterium]|jgi:uncharacterized membrane protein|nr:glycosyltransferase family 39 protein [Patescibacteria group bacterium]